MAEHKKVLIIDDDPTLQEMYSGRFKKSHFEVLSATNGDLGIKLALEERPDIILLDLMMPVKGGLGALDVLKTMPETKDIPTIILTAYPDDTYRVKSTRSGADLFLSKSEIMPGDVVQKVQELLDQQVTG